MSAESPNGNETPKQAEKAEETDVKEIGYPPKGQKEQLAKIKAAEAAQNNNPEAILAELDHQETETVRTERLVAFVAKNFPDCPTELHGKASQACKSYEDDTRDFLEEPEFKITAEDIPDLKPKVEKFLTVAEKEEDVTQNKEAIAENDQDIAEESSKKQTAAATVETQNSEKSEISGEITKENTKTTILETKHDELNDTRDEERQKESDKETDLKTIEQAQSQKGSKGTVGVLKMLLEPGRLKSPEMRGKVQQVLAKLQNVSKLGTTPEAQNFFQQAVQQSDVDLSASSPNQIYASLISNIDAGLASGAITQSDANAARVSLGVSPKTTNEPYKIPKDSSQMARDLRERRNTEKQVPKIDPSTGEAMVDEEGNIIYETITEENNDVIPIDHPSLEIYLKPEPGSDAYDVHILSDSRLPLVERIDANNFAMGGMREINYLVATADMEQQGFTDMFGSQFTSNEVRRHNFNNFMQATGMDPDFGSLWTTEHSNRIRQMMQMLHPRGDLGRDDVNPNKWKERATELGVYDQKTDQWDYDALSLMRNSKTFDTVGKDGEALLRSGEVGS